jgi:hypothetical protein
MTAPLKVQYFEGNSEDFDGLIQDIDSWLGAGNFAKYQLNSTPHWNEQQQRWEVLVTIMYHSEAGAPNQIAIPRMMMPRRAN